jgi:hypothetical protein
MQTLICPRCGYEWEPRIPNPNRCPCCRLIFHKYWEEVPAGGYVKVHLNTFMESPERAVGIRGIPIEGVRVYKNWALYDPNKFTSEWVFIQSLGNLPGHTLYEKMWVYDNWLGPNPPPPTPAASTKEGVFLNGE